MAEYNITVEILGVTLASMTAEQIIQALQTYEAGSGTELIPGALIDGLPTVEGSDMTGNEIVTAVNEGADTAFIWERVAPIPKLRIMHCENALNWLATTNPASSAFQTYYGVTGRILKMDFIIVAEIFSVDNIYQNGDWLIALVDNPGFTFTDTAKWLHIKYSKLAWITAAIFRQNATNTTSGIESIPGQSTASGTHSFAPNKETEARGEGSTALGVKSKATRIGEVAESGGIFTAVGDAQRTRFNMRLKTTNSTPTQMVLPSLYGFETGKCYMFSIHIMGAVQGGKAAKAWDYRFLAAIDNEGYVAYDGGGEEINAGANNSNLEFGSPAISASIQITNTDAAVPPPGMFKGFIITCTGIANTNVFWSCYIDSFEVATI